MNIVVLLPKLERLGDEITEKHIMFFSPNGRNVHKTGIPSRKQKQSLSNSKCSDLSIEKAGNHFSHSLIKNYKHHDTIIIILSHSYQWNIARLIISQSGDVETNPGPIPGYAYEVQPVEIKAITYNTRGLKDKLKLKRVLNKCYEIFRNKRDSFVFFQETHLEEEDLIHVKFLWRHGIVFSPSVGRQGGTMILFDESWEVVKTEHDNEGRFCLLSVKKYGHHICFCNIYAPNNHCLNYFSDIYEKIANHCIEYPETKTVLGGDFNLVMEQLDSLNRGTNNAEIRSKTFIKEQNVLMDMVDCYRAVYATGGYTWSRGNCMSRLDMFFVSNELISKGVKAGINWGFDMSDHAMVEITLKINNVTPKGKGLFRLNTDVLDNPETLLEIKTELQLQLAEIPENWNPHVKLDFVKMAIRSIVGVISGREKKKCKTEQEALANQLNILKITKGNLLSQGTHGPTLEQIEVAIAELEELLKTYLDKQSKDLIRRSGAKWYEKGECSNTYFLNLIKQRSNQILIDRLEGENGMLTNQIEIADHIVEFYSKLYEEKNTSDNYNDLLSDLPKLSDEDRNQLDEPISTEELESTLKGCTESAPGPDGLSYKVYKILWEQVGAYLLDSWNYSVRVGILPEDQRISCITLLPKSGKNLEKIENWRPITLTNCDLKIFTKLISNRVTTKLDKLISVSQTAYIPGRVVHDNLRMFEFYKKYCKENNIDALLVSLDAKKAFDSVSHKYLKEVLKAYGFSDNFIDLVKLLYRDLKANIMINGYKSVIIKIARSVKQGDALSCALFILCIDPLIRKLENNDSIVAVPIPRSRYTNISIKNKIGAFADDVGAVVMNDPGTIGAIFDTYNLFSQMSGIELNVDKTEILKLNVDSTVGPFVPVAININNYIVHTKESVKICGITYSNNKDIEYNSNTLEKITKLEQQLIRWLPRNLTVEGKLVIVKTFGLSQLIYSMQIREFQVRDLNKIESIIFKFLWNRRWHGSAPDRIKRSFLKNSYEKGGLNAPDIKILDKALKTRQFIRAMESNHHVKWVQMYQLEKIGYFEYYKLEYAKMCDSDIIIKSYQQTINELTDFVRISENRSEIDLSQTRINVIASTDIIEYLRKKKIPLALLLFNELANNGIENFHELVNEQRYPRSDRLRDAANNILGFFPVTWQALMRESDNINPNLNLAEQFYGEKWKLKQRSKISVKGLKNILIDCQNYIPAPYYNYQKFELGGLDNLNHNPFIVLRKSLKAPKDRFFKYRLLHGDVFCNTRMFRFKMVDSPNCKFCSSLETIKHLIWDCERSARVWRYINELTKNYLNTEYINYNTIVLGNENPLPAMEVIIVWVLRLIMAIEREQLILNEAILLNIKTLFFYERTCFGSNSKKFKSRWGRLIELFHDNR